MIAIDDLYLKKRIPEIGNLDLTVNDGETYVLLSSGENAIAHLINILSGTERDFRGDVRIDGKDILGESDESPHKPAVLSRGKHWPPDMKVSSILSALKKRSAIEEDQLEALYIKSDMERMQKKRFGELSEVERLQFLFLSAQLKGCKNYVVWDFVKGMPLDFIIRFKNNIQEMKQKGCAILYLSDDVFFAPEIGDRVGFMKKGKLLLELKGTKMRKMKLQDLYFKFLGEK